MKRNERPSFAVVACVIALSLSTQAGTIYVDAEAAGVNDGSSWVNAYVSLQDALADANAAEKPVEIRVAQGTYTPDRGTSVSAGDRLASFRIVRGIALKGGFAGVRTASPDGRDVTKYHSILSGDLNGDDAPTVGVGQLLGEPTRSENCRHVVTIADAAPGDSNEGSLVKDAGIDGFTITGGQDDVESLDLASEGGAGLLLLSGILTLMDCTIQSCATCNVGGGMYTTAQCRVNLRHCVFTQNYAQYGGGIGSGQLYAVSEGCRLAMTDCSLRDNLAFQGGGLFCYGGLTEATGCTFSDNAASGSERAAFGGGMYVLGGELVLTNCSFTGNAADRAGGAISQATGHAQMISCTFTRNSADVGGAIDTSACDSRLDGCSFTGNAAPSGGGLYSISSPLTIRHCLFAGNGSGTASRRPFGTHREGGAIYLSGSASVSNCTFHGNLAQKGRSIWMSQSDVALTNCILWDADDPVCADEGDRPSVTYSDLPGTWPGEGNIEVDPCFAQPGYWDPNGTPDEMHDDFWVDGDYHLRSRAGRWVPGSRTWTTDETSSLCIDAGDPNSPIGDEPSPNGGRVNIGAYGGTVEASMSWTPPRPDEIAGP
jgi:hypothetical protein